MLRAAAVAAAVALLVAPQWGAILTAAVRVAQAARDAAKAHGKTARTAAAAGLIVAAAWGKVPLPQLPTSAPPVVINVPTPSHAMIRIVTPVRDVLQGAPIGQRMIWAAVWQKAALVAAGDAVSTDVVFSDTRSLAAFTTLAIEIGWRRMGGVEPGTYRGLREAVEAAMREVLTSDVQPVTKELRDRYAEVCRAIAWASLPPGG